MTFKPPLKVGRLNVVVLPQMVIEAIGPWVGLTTLWTIKWFNRWTLYYQETSCISSDLCCFTCHPNSAWHIHFSLSYNNFCIYSCMRQFNWLFQVINSICIRNTFFVMLQAISILFNIIPKLIYAVGRRIATETGELWSTDFLLQRLSVAVQRGNCASVLGRITTCFYSCIIT